MRLEVNGVQYTNFVSASCEIRLDALSNSFSFEAVAPEGQPIPFKGGEECRVIVDGEPVLTGYIEVISVNYNGEDHTINISGRDKTADLLDSSLDFIDDIGTEELTLKSLIEKILAKLGIAIQVIDQASPEKFNPAEDLAAPEPGDNAFSFIEKYARKRQVLLTSDANGNIVIAKNSGQKLAGAIQHIIGATDNNVMASNYSYDTTGRYNAYKISSGMSPSTLNLSGETDLASLVNQGGGAFDKDIRKSRQLVLISEAPFSDSPCADRAKWELDIRRARGLAYSATVPLFRVGGTSGDLWQINKLYQIVDDYIGKKETMLCNSVKFSYSVDSGSTTDLGFVGKDAYTLFIEETTTDDS